MVLVIESRYLRILHEKFRGESRESYELAIKMLEREGENARWDKDHLVKDVISEFKRMSEISYEEFVKEYFLKDSDVAKALFEYNDGSLVIYQLIEKTGCNLVDAVRQYDDYVNFLRKMYDKNMKLKEKYGNIIIDKDMVKSLRRSTITVLEGFTLGNVIDNITLFHPEEIDEIEEYLNKRSVK